MSSPQPDMASQAAMRQSMDDAAINTRSSANLPSASDSVMSEGQARLGEGIEGLGAKVNSGLSLGENSGGFNQILSVGGMDTILPKNGAFSENILSLIREQGLGHDLGAGIQGANLNLQQMTASEQPKVPTISSPSQSGQTQAMG